MAPNSVDGISPSFSVTHMAFVAHISTYGSWPPGLTMGFNARACGLGESRLDAFGVFTLTTRRLEEMAAHGLVDLLGAQVT